MATPRLRWTPACIWNATVYPVLSQRVTESIVVRERRHERAEGGSWPRRGIVTPGHDALNLWPNLRLAPGGLRKYDLGRRRDSTREILMFCRTNLLTLLNLFVQSKTFIYARVSIWSSPLGLISSLGFIPVMTLHFLLGSLMSFQCLHVLLFGCKTTREHLLDILK